MTAFISAPGASPPPPSRPAQEERRKLVLESLDGSRRIALDNSTGWKATTDVTGLEMPPMEVVRSAPPGVAGSLLRDVRVQERPIFIPIIAEGTSAIGHAQMLDALRELVDPLVGEFRLVGVSSRSVRELVVVYTGGLEGAEGQDVNGRFWRKFGLTAVACDPFAYDRVERLVTFRASGTSAPFIGAVGGTNAIWPTRLTSSLVIGAGMQIRVDSEVPVYPTLELTGPMTSFTGSMSTGWSVSIPNGVPAGSTFRLVTNPREKSMRLNGANAAGSVARGSTLKPFLPGLNVLDVTAPGGSDATRVALSWREAHRSLW